MPPQHCWRASGALLSVAEYIQYITDLRWNLIGCHDGDLMSSLQLRRKKARLREDVKMAVAEVPRHGHVGYRNTSASTKIKLACASYSQVRYFWSCRSVFSRCRFIHFCSDGVRVGGRETEVVLVWDAVVRKAAWAPPQDRYFSQPMKGFLAKLFHLTTFAFQGLCFNRIVIRKSKVREAGPSP